MNTKYAAMIEGNAAVVIWCGMGIAVLWIFYMMTFRTEDWLRLVKDEQERKARRREQTSKVLKGAFVVAKWWLKK